MLEVSMTKLKKLYESFKEASFEIRPFLDIKNKLSNVNEVTEWVRGKHYDKHGYCQTIAALYDYVDNGKGKGIMSFGHVAYIDGNKVYDPINFSRVPVEVEEWKKKFPINQTGNLITM